jgi:uncharacterized protein
MLSRRTFLKWIASLGGLGVLAYAFAVEPLYRLRIQRYALTLASWGKRAPLKIVILSDIHSGLPYMPVSRLEKIVAQALELKPDIFLLLGDYVSGPRLRYADVPAGEWAHVLARLKAPLGTYAILGNADGWDGGVTCRTALLQVGIPVLENTAVRIHHKGAHFWLAGLADQLHYRKLPTGQWVPLADMGATQAQMTGDEPAILMAHEPQIFPEVPKRFALTLSGHTHGGQLRIAGWSPFSPHSHGNRYAYGHIQEGEKNLIVSGGLGLSTIPVRLGVPPEITVVDIQGSQAS